MKIRIVLLVAVLFLLAGCGNCPSGVNYSYPSCPGYIPYSGYGTTGYGYNNQYGYGSGYYPPGYGTSYYNPSQPYLYQGSYYYPYSTGYQASYQCPCYIGLSYCCYR